MPEDAAQPSLPSRRQLAGLRDFLLARAAAVGAVASSPMGEPPQAGGSSTADARHAARALYFVVNFLSRRVLDAVYRGQASDAARDAWGMLLLISQEWRDSPDMPEELKELVEAHFPR